MSEELEGVKDQETAELEEEELDMEGEEEPEGEQEQESAEPVQSKEERALYAKIRRQEEEKAKAKTQKLVDEKIAGFNWVNPYKQNKPIRNEEDYNEFVRMNEEEQKKQDPDYDPEDNKDREYVRNQRKAEAAKKEAEEFAKKNLADFGKDYPDIDPDKIMSNPKFKKFAKGKYGSMSLSEIYADFTEVISETEEAAFLRARSKAERNTGSGNGGGVTLTPEQKKNLNEWNERYPDKKMTAKEYLAR